MDNKLNNKNHTNKDRILNLISKNQLVLPSHSSTSKISTSDSFITKQINQNAIVGCLCGCVVVGKDQMRKQISLYALMTYDGFQVINISGNRIRGFMKDFELKVDSSIFTYLNNFKELQVGTFINAWARRIEKREEGFGEGKVTKNMIEFVFNRQTNIKQSSIQVGVIKDHIMIPSSIMKVFEKEGILPINFQIVYMRNFENPGLILSLLSSLKLNPVGSMHRISNIPALSQMNFQLQRLHFSLKQDSAYPINQVARSPSQYGD